jgi:hypothetical protein
MDYFPRKSLSKYLTTDTIDFNKHVHDIHIFINDKWRKYAGGDIGWLFKITRRLELRFWPTRKRSQPSQGDFFARIALQREPCLHEPHDHMLQCNIVLNTGNTKKKLILTNVKRFYSTLIPPPEQGVCQLWLVKHSGKCLTRVLFNWYTLSLLEYSTEAIIIGILITRQTSGIWSVYNEGQQGSS